MEKSKIITVSCLFKVEAQYVAEIERQLGGVTEIVSFEHLPDTKELYNTDKEFKRLVDNKKKSKDAWRAYLNNQTEEF